MKNNKLRIICLSLAIVIVVAAGALMLLPKLNPQEEYLPPVNEGSERYYNEELLYSEPTTFKMNERFFYYEDKVCQIETDKTDLYLVESESRERILSLPTTFEDTKYANICFADKNTIGTVYYDAEKGLPVYEEMDLEGNIKTSIDLADFKGVVFDEKYLEIYKLLVNKQYVYIQTMQGRSSAVYIYDRKDGRQIHVRENVSCFDTDGDGNAYIVDFTHSDSISVYKIKERKETPLLTAGNTVLGVKTDISNKYIHAVTSDCAEVYEIGTKGLAGKAVDIGEDTGYILNSEFTLCDYAVDKDGKVFTKIKSSYGEMMNITTYKYTAVEGKRPEKEVTLTLTMPYKNTFVQNAIKQFELKYPQEKVKYDYTYESQDEYRRNLEQNALQFTAEILAGETGDIVLTGGGNVSYYDFFKTDAFMDLTELIEKDKNYENLNKNVLEGIKIDGAIRGLPVLYNPTYIEYNRELAESLELEIDTDNLKWSDVLKLTKELEAKGSDVTVFGSKNQDGSIHVVDMINANIMSLIDFDTGTVNLDEEWFIDLMSEWKECMKSKNFINLSTPYNKRTEKSLFTFVNMIQADYHNEISYMSSNGNGVEYIPVFTGEMSDNRIAYTRFMLSIYGKSENKESAWKFLSFMLEEDVQTTTGVGDFKPMGFPLNISSVDKIKDTTKANDPKISGEVERISEDFEEICGKIDYMYDTGYVKSDIYNAFKKYFEDEISLDEAVKQAEEAVTIRLNE